MASYVTALDRSAPPAVESEHQPIPPVTTWVQRAACTGRSDLFEDGSRSQQKRALAICGDCPVLACCQPWALREAVDGIAGGMTLQERQAWRADHGLAEPTLSLEEFLPIGVVARDARFQRGGAEVAVVLAAIAERTVNGESAADIGDLFGTTERNIQRFRAKAGVVGQHPLSPRRAAAS